MSAAKQLPPQQQALLLLRTLAYDRNLKSRAGALITVAVLEKDTSCAQVVEAIREVSLQLKVSGLPVNVVSIAWSGKEGETRLRAAKAAAVYICSGMDAVMGDVKAATRELAILSFSAEQSQVEKGLSVGLVNRNDKATLLINLAASKSEGADLDSAVLRVAEVVR